MKMSNDKISRKLNWKIINTFLIVICFSLPFLLLIKISYDSNLIVSPLMPKYFMIYVHGSTINTICFIIGGLIPAIFLRIRKLYFISNICIIIFLLIGYLMKNSIKIYEHFYILSKYLE